MKKILMIATGGTIACRVSENGGLSPALSSHEIVEYVPELAEICDIHLTQLFNLDSTNIGPEQWLAIAGEIARNIDAYDGIVITHGTDTMAYTAAALSYLIQNPRIPIVFTGSQKSISSRDTDARYNLICAFRYASSDAAWGVQIVFDGKVILGTRARKVRSKSLNAFASIDFPETAVFHDQRLIPYIPAPPAAPMKVYTQLDPRVFNLKLIPGITADVFSFLTGRYRAVIIEGFGVGGLPGYNDGALLKAVTEWVGTGHLAVLSTQVQHEGSDIAVYDVGRSAVQLSGLLEAGVMTPEAVSTKLMWALAAGQNMAEVEALFRTPVQFDII